MTLVELLSATVIMVGISAALAALAMSVENGGTYSQGRTEAAQHARVVIDRIQRRLLEAQASAEFPGFFVVPQQSGNRWFPDTLVVWSPETEAADPEGLPLWKDVVVYCPDESSPNRLLEIVNRSDNRPVPALDDEIRWQSELSSFKSNPMATRTQLTDLLRVVSVSGTKRASGNPRKKHGENRAIAGSTERGAVRFRVEWRPSDSEIEQFDRGELEWQELAWPQGLCGWNTGLRQAWCAFELQLMPGPESLADDPTGETAIPFLGSAALYYDLHKQDVETNTQ